MIDNVGGLQLSYRIVYIQFPYILLSTLHLTLSSRLLISAVQNVGAHLVLEGYTSRSSLASLEERRGMSRCEIATQSIKQLTRAEISTALLWSLPRDGKGPHRRERLY